MKITSSLHHRQRRGEVGDNAPALLYRQVREPHHHSSPPSPPHDSPHHCRLDPPTHDTPHHCRLGLFPHDSPHHCRLGHLQDPLNRGWLATRMGYGVESILNKLPALHHGLPRHPLHTLARQGALGAWGGGGERPTALPHTHTQAYSNSIYFAPSKHFFSFRGFPFLLESAVGCLGSEFCMLVVDWRL